MTVLAISPLTLPTALSTPLPKYRDLSASRSSSASCSPVDAPEGTAARPRTPAATYTSASTVGLPRESRTCRACTRVIFVDMSICSPKSNELEIVADGGGGSERLELRTGTEKEFSLAVLLQTK